jgi:cysteine desulfurase
VEVVRLGVDHNGLISLEELQAELEKPTTLVSIQWANNETGVIQPIEKVAQLCKSAGALFHSDIAQAVGRLKIDLAGMPIDFASFTGHKFHAPPGTGCLYAKSVKSLHPLFFGGSQEKGFRPGTENMPSLVAMGCAASIRNSRLESYQKEMRWLRDSFEAKVLAGIPDVKVNGTTESRVVNTSNLCFGGLDGQALVARLGQEGLMCSQSSACTNQRPEPSFVLRAMGLSEEEAYGSIRFSFSVLNSISDVEKAVRIISLLCEKLRAFYI